MTDDRIRCGTGLDVDKAEADGTITTGDADEIRRFAAFLREAGPLPGRPGHDPVKRRDALSEHYPEDIARMSNGPGTGGTCPRCGRAGSVHTFAVPDSAEWCEDCDLWIDDEDEADGIG